MNGREKPPLREKDSHEGRFAAPPTILEFLQNGPDEGLQSATVMVYCTRLPYGGDAAGSRSLKIHTTYLREIRTPDGLLPARRGPAVSGVVLITPTMLRTVPA